MDEKKATSKGVPAQADAAKENALVQRSERARRRDAQVERFAAYAKQTLLPQLNSTAEGLRRRGYRVDIMAHGPGFEAGSTRSEPSVWFRVNAKGEQGTAIVAYDLTLTFRFDPARARANLTVVGPPGKGAPQSDPETNTEIDIDALGARALGELVLTEVRRALGG